MSSISDCAALLDDAARHVQEVAQFDTGNTLSLESAYAIQAASIQRRIARSERRVGVKMGFTSRAKMVQMGLDDVIWGRLTSGMQLEEGGAVAFSRFVHPRVEPEIAFILKRPLAGDVTGPEALAAVEAIAPALELIDSRFKDFKFTLPKVIADDASSSGFVIGAWHDPLTDFSNPGLTLSIDGRVTQVGHRSAARSSAALAGGRRTSVGACRGTSAGGLDCDGGRRDAGRMDRARPVRFGRTGKAWISGVPRGDVMSCGVLGPSRGARRARDLPRAVPVNAWTGRWRDRCP